MLLISCFWRRTSLEKLWIFQELCDLILLEIRVKTQCRKIKKAIRHILAIDSTEIKVLWKSFNEPGWKQKILQGRAQGFGVSFT